MDLSQFEDVIIERQKIHDYLLSTTHPDGYAKARFFIRNGLNEESFPAFLIKHLESNNPNNTISTSFGTKFIINENVTAPNGYSFLMRSVWFQANGNKILRFVTAYPI